MACFAGPLVVDLAERILLFEADDDTADMYSVGLRLAGFQPLVAADAETAGRRLHAEKPAAVVADTQDAARRDWAFLRAIRADPDTADVPVILISGHRDVDVHQRAAQFGCAAVLFKPCLPDALAQAVRAAADRSAFRSGPSTAWSLSPGAHHETT